MNRLLFCLGVSLLIVALPDECVVVLLLLGRVYVPVVVIRNVLLAVAGIEGMQI